jgi:hypothetical protein
MKFKEFLNESTSSYKKKISLEEAAEIIKKNCTGFIDHGKVLYRGSYSYMPDENYLLSIPETVRKSANTSNHYTLALDHVLKEKNWPLRSKSWICSTNADEASNYGDDYKVIIPFDATKVGIVHANDIWFKAILNTITFEEFADTMKDLEIRDDTYQDMVHDCFTTYNDELDADTYDYIDEFKELFGDKIKSEKDVEERLDWLFDPDRIKFKLTNGKDMDIPSGKSECWVGGGHCLAIDNHEIKTLKKMLGMK